MGKILSDAEMADFEAPAPVPAAASPRILSDEEMAAHEAPAGGVSEAPSALQTDLRQLAAGAAGNFDDELNGLLEGAGRVVGVGGLGTARHLERGEGLSLQTPTLSFDKILEAYRAGRDSARADNLADHEVNPGRAIAANIAGSFVSPAAALKVAQGEGAFANIANAAAQGGALSLGESDADLTKGELKNAALDTAKGGAIGGIAGSAVEVLKAGLNPDNLEKFANSRSFAAQGGDKAAVRRLGTEAAQAQGSAGLEHGIVTPLASTSDMVKRAEALSEAGGQGMKGVYDAIDQAGASTFNPRQVAGQIESELGGFYRSPINKDVSNQLDNLLESINMRAPDGASVAGVAPMPKSAPMTTAQGLKSEIGRVAYPNGRKINPDLITDKQRMAQQAYGIVNKAIDKSAQAGAEALGRPDLVEKLAESKAMHGAGEGALGLLANKEAREMGNKLGFGLTDTVTGVGGYAALGPKGLALLAGKKLAEKYGNQTAAVAADKLADVVRSTPEALGPWAKQLLDAASRGGASLAATNYVLQQTDPKYREHMKTMFNGN